MNIKTIKPLYILLTLAFLINLVPIFHNVACQARKRIYVDPAENEFFTDTTSVGATFTVSIKAADWADPGVFSYQLTFQFDPTLLEATAAEIPDGHWLTPTIKPANLFVVDSGTFDNTLGTVSFSATLLSPELGKTGGGTIATITLKIIDAPAAGQSFTSSLGFKEFIMVNPDAAEIVPKPPDPNAVYDVVPGTFLYSTPPPPWYVKVEPHNKTASVIGDTVTIDVKLYEAAVDGKITGVQFRLLYPDILTTTEDKVSEGPFIKSFGETFFIAFVEPDAQGNPSVIAVVLLLPDETGQHQHFVEGSGVLTTITFELVEVPEQPTKFPLTLTDVIIVDSESNPVPYRRLEDAEIMAPRKLEDLNEDWKVDILDMATFAVAFGSNPASPRWNPKVDITDDGKVNILDGVLIAKSFGFTA
jgi:hypothetical protein